MNLNFHVCWALIKCNFQQIKYIQKQHHDLYIDMAAYKIEHWHINEIVYFLSHLIYFQKLIIEKNMGDFQI